MSKELREHRKSNRSKLTKREETIKEHGAELFLDKLLDKEQHSHENSFPPASIRRAESMTRPQYIDVKPRQFNVVSTGNLKFVKPKVETTKKRISLSHAELMKLPLGKRATVAETDFHFMSDSDEEVNMKKSVNSFPKWNPSPRIGKIPQNFRCEKCIYKSRINLEKYFDFTELKMQNYEQSPILSSSTDLELVKWNSEFVRPMSKCTYCYDPPEDVKESLKNSHKQENKLLQNVNNTKISGNENKYRIEVKPASMRNKLGQENAFEIEITEKGELLDEDGIEVIKIQDDDCDPPMLKRRPSWALKVNNWMPQEQSPKSVKSDSSKFSDSEDEEDKKSETEVCLVEDFHGISAVENTERDFIAECIKNNISSTVEKVDNTESIKKLFQVLLPKESEEEIQLNKQKNELLNIFYDLDPTSGERKLQFNKIRDNLDEFALLPVAPGVVVECLVTRYKDGIYPTYSLYIEREGKNCLVLVARKRKKSVANNYIISTNPENITRKSDSYIGKVRSNLVGTEFTIYDRHLSYKDLPWTSLDSGWEVKCREELASVRYETNVWGLNGPRKMTVVIPGLTSDATRREVRPETDHETLIERYQNDATSNLIVLKNKAPVWNSETQSFVLNFQGRVTHPSVKNFIVVSNKNENYSILQFGRVGDDSFTLDCRYPLCPLQAFGIVLTSLDSKIACE